MQTNLNFSANQALKTPQFWFLWIMLFYKRTAAAAGFAGILSLANMAGRFVWSTASDYIGRKNIYLLYLGVGVLFYLLIAFVGNSSLIVNSVVESQATAGAKGPDLYTVSMYIMVGLLAIGLVANILMRPVAEKHTIEYDLKH